MIVNCSIDLCNWLILIHARMCGQDDVTACMHGIGLAQSQYYGTWKTF